MALLVHFAQEIGAQHQSGWYGMGGVSVTLQLLQDAQIIDDVLLKQLFWAVAQVRQQWVWTTATVNVVKHHRQHHRFAYVRFHRTQLLHDIVDFGIESDDAARISVAADTSIGEIGIHWALLQKLHFRATIDHAPLSDLTCWPARYSCQGTT